MIKVCVREGYVDAHVAKRIDENILVKPPYNFQLISLEDKFEDVVSEDFVFENNAYVFSLERYNKRKQRILAQEKIIKLKNFLLKTDYQAIKFAEGVISKEKYLDVFLKRQSARDEIDLLEQLINEKN